MHKPDRYKAKSLKNVSQTFSYAVVEAKKEKIYVGSLELIMFKDTNFLHGKLNMN